MKIAIDARELGDKPTGVGRLLRELLVAWQSMPEARGHEFIELMPDGHGRSGGTLWEQAVLPSLVRDAAADVLFAPAYSGPLLSPVPMVVAIHDVSFAAHPEWFAWREGARRRTVVQMSARSATRIITISQFSKREIVSYLGVDASKVVVAYPGVSRLRAPNTAGPPRHGVGGHVLYVGSVFNRRHIPELILGFARLARTRPEMQLDIVGDNRTTPRLDLAAMIQATGIPDRIHLRSYVPEEELRQLYARADAFAFLSEYEGFGLTPLEALASGIPPLLLDTAIARETCGDAAAYVARPDPALIEKALDTILFDAAERQRIIMAAGPVLGRYSWSDCARRVLSVLIEAAHA